jgi:hypothetical protein
MTGSEAHTEAVHHHVYNAIALAIAGRWVFTGMDTWCMNAVPENTQSLAMRHLVWRWTYVQVSEKIWATHFKGVIKTNAKTKNQKYQSLGCCCYVCFSLLWITWCIFREFAKCFRLHGIFFRVWHLCNSVKFSLSSFVLVVFCYLYEFL